MRLSSLRLVSLAAQQTRASVSSLVLFNLPQPGLPVCDLTISSESKVMKLLMPHSCFQLGVFFSLKRNMSRRMEFSKLSLKGTSVQPILHIHGFCIWELNHHGLCSTVVFTTEKYSHVSGPEQLTSIASQMLLMRST